MFVIVDNENDGNEYDKKYNKTEEWIMHARRKLVWKNTDRKIQSIQSIIGASSLHRRLRLNDTGFL
jgi:hypothetical protein